MPLVHRAISNLFGGVSQQAAGVRLDNQCEELINAYPSIADGLVKRPPTELISVIPADAAESSMFHTINRDGDEKYIVIFTGDASVPIEVRAIDGTSRVVSYGTLDEVLVLTPDASVKDYVSGGIPADDIAAVTAADYTVVVNKTKTVEMLAPANPTFLPIALVSIPHGVAEQTYKIYVNGNLVADYTAGATTAPATWRTTAIAAGLYSDLIANLTDGWEISVDGSTIFIVSTTGDDFTFKVEDSWGNQAMVGIKESVRRFEDLPTTLPSGLDHDFDVVTIHQPAEGYFIVYVDGVQKARQAGGSISVNEIALRTYNQLVVNLLSNPLFRVSHSGSNITIWRTDGEHSTITVDHSAAQNPEQFITVVASTVIDFTNAVFAVKPDPTVQQGTYYVRWNTLADDGKTTSGNWEECPARGIRVALDPSTMPHRLVRLSDGTFAFAPIVWEDREVGDEISAPDPTFVGAEIQDTFFFKNRLGFLSKGSTTLSRAGEYFDFFPTTATDVLDDDPIDSESSSKQVSVLRYGLPFQAQLILFSDQQQFSLGSGDKLLTPGTAAGDTVASVAVDRCEPISAGSNIYFASPSGEYTAIREMFVSPNTLTPDSAEVSAHCPTYIPANIKKMAACEGKKTVFVWSYDDLASIYVYKYYWNGDEKIQSAWGKWTFSAEIVYMDVIDNCLYLMFSGGSGSGGGSVVSPMDLVEYGAEFALYYSLDSTIFDELGLVGGDSVTLSGFDTPGNNETFVVDRMEGGAIIFPAGSALVAEFETVDSRTVTKVAGASVVLERINLETKAITAGQDFKVLLDRQEVLSGAYDSGVTNFEASYPVLSTDRAFNGSTKECVDVTVTGTAAFSVPGNWSGDTVIFGRPYEMDHRFSEFGMKSSDPKVYNRAGRCQLRTMNFSFEDTMAFDIVTSTAGRADTTQRFRASSPTTGEKRFVTLGDSRTTRVSIKSDSHLPCKFGGVSYEVMYAQRSK